MRYYIITGTTSGIGEALAKQLLKKREKVFCISRNSNQMLTELAQNTGGWLRYFKANLTEIQKLPDLLTKIFSDIDTKNASHLTLINNAGVLEPVGYSGTLNNQEIGTHLTTNLLAPAILINTFIELSANFNIPRTILNISSGAASNPYPGWSNYCASKAALDMLTRTIGMEQRDCPNPVRIFSLAPGIVDSNMQKTIRGTSKEQFPLRNKFDKLHQENKLSKPDEVANKIISLLSSYLPSTGEIADLRNL